MYKNWQKSLLLMGVGAFCIFIFRSEYRVGLNLSASIKPGFYLLKKTYTRPLAYDETVAFFLAQQQAHLVKRVLALPGDMICRYRHDRLFVYRQNALYMVLPLVSQIRSVWDYGCQRIVDGYFVVGRSMLSFDSRYFGLINENDKLMRARLLAHINVDSL